MSYYDTLIEGTPGIKAYYKENETSGTVAHDSTSNGYHGTLTGSLTYGISGAINGDSDTAIGFTAPGGLNIPWSTLNITTWTAITVDFWIKISGAWQYVAVTSNATTDLLYLNGTPYVSGAGDEVVIDSGLAFLGSPAASKMAKTAIYNVVLTPAQILQRFSVGQALFSGGYTLSANGTGTASFDHFRATFYPDPALDLSNVGRATSTLAAWNATLPTNTGLTVATSQDNGVTWSTVASSGSAIPGITTPPASTFDTFDSDSSASYSQSNFSGATGSWAWDTANSRLSGSGGTNGTLVYNTALTGADSWIMADLDQADGGGLIANYQSASALYYVQIWDASGVTAQNTVKLYRRSGGVSTQVGSTVTIDFTRGRPKRFILDVQAGALTVSMDGAPIITYTDGSPLAAGKSGLLLNALLRCYNLRIQQYGQDVSSLPPLATKLTLSSTDPTATPQVLDAQIFVSSEDIGIGTLVPSADYRRKYLSNNIGDLARKSDYTFNVKNDKSVVFHERTAFPAPWILDSGNVRQFAGQSQGDILVKDLKLSTGGQLYRNQQILTGVVSTITDSWQKSGDGSTRTWALNLPLAAPPTIYVNGQLVTVGVLNVDSGKQYYYQLGSTTITQDSGQTVLATTDTISVPSYQGSTTTEVVRNNAVPGTFAGTTSQQELAARDRTSGIVQNVLDVSTENMSVAAAQAYGDSLLQLYGNLQARTLTFSTLRSGLSVGQQLTAFVPEQSCVDVSFLIIAITITAQLAPSVPGGVLYFFNVVCTEGANLGSPVKQLSSLLRK